MQKIKSIKKITTDKERFYNLAVKDDESYIANDIVVHNCRSRLLYITTTDVTEDKITPDKDANLNALGKLDGGNNFLS